MTAQELIEYAAKLGPNEECWVLRAQDILAPNTIRYWAHAAAGAGVPMVKVNNAMAVADRMEAHQPRKIPD